jgi:predicted lactoylglutathione lyase
MEQRISAVTLGVHDLARARAFYGALGWMKDLGQADVAFFQAGGMVFAIWDRAKLAEDSCMQDDGGWGGITVAYNVRSPEEVDAVLTEAQAAGATVPRAGTKTPWGGYSGIFVDPEGHPWEVAHNPAWTVNDDGTVSLS